MLSSVGGDGPNSEFDDSENRTMDPSTENVAIIHVIDETKNRRQGME